MLAENTSGMQEDRREHRIGIDRADSPCSLHMLHSRLLVGLELWTVVAAMDPQRTIQRLNLEAASTSLFPAVMYDFSPRRVVNVIRSSGMTLGKSLKKKSTNYWLPQELRIRSHSHMKTLLKPVAHGVG